MSDTEPRYYDPETGEPNTDAFLNFQLRDAGWFVRNELARLQRERDEVSAERDGLIEQLHTVRREFIIEATNLTTERAAREKAERERNGAIAKRDVLARERDAAMVGMETLANQHESTLATLRAELRMARRRERLLEVGVSIARYDGGFAPVWGHATYYGVAEVLLPLCHKCNLWPTRDAATDATWSALHAAGLVEDEG